MGFWGFGWNWNSNLVKKMFSVVDTDLVFIENCSSYIA